MIKQNPCRYCINSKLLSGKRVPGHPNCPCENWELHQDFLETKRKYEPGEVIRTLSELEQESIVFVINWGKVVSIKVIENLQYNLVAKMLKEKRICKAKRKGE